MAEEKVESGDPKTSDIDSEESTAFIDSDEALNQMIEGLDMFKTKDPESEEEADSEKEEEAEEAAAEGEEESEEEESEAEASEDAEESEEEEEEEEEESEEEEQPKDNIGFRKKITKLTARAKTAEKELKETKQESDNKIAELEEEIQELSKGGNVVQVVSGVKGELSSVWKDDDLDKMLVDAEHVIDLANDHPDGFTTHEGTEKEKFWTPEELRGKRAEARELQKEVPKRKKFLNEFGVNEGDAKKLFPWMFDTKHKAYTVFKQVMKQNPELKLLPNHHIIIGDAMVGQYIREAQENEASKKALKKKVGKKKAKDSSTKSKKAPKQPGGKVPKSSVGKSINSPELMKSAGEGDSDAIEALIKAKLTRR